MREILFRGKEISNGAWVYGDLAHHKDGRTFIRFWTENIEKIKDAVCVGNIHDNPELLD